MERELRMVLGNHRYHTRVVRARRHLGEDDLVALDKHLHAEDAVASERVGNLPCDMLRLRFRLGRHSLRLPRLAVVAVHLPVSDGFEERSAVDGTDGEERYLIVEIDKTLHDDAPCTGTPALLRLGPCVFDVLSMPDSGLPVSRRGHDRLDHAGDANLLHGGEKVLARVGKAVRSGGQQQLLGGKTADGFPVHSKKSRVSRRDNAVVFLLQLYESRGGNGFYLGDNEGGMLLLDHSSERVAVQHIEDV